MSVVQIGSILTQGSDLPRPDFGKRQIRQVAQIYKGQLLRIRSMGGYNLLITVKRGPYKEDGCLKLDFEFRKGQKVETGKIFLEDHSVIRDSFQEWNRTNWLEKV